MSAWTSARSVVRPARPRGRLLAPVGLLALATAFLAGAGVAHAQDAGTAQSQTSRWWLGGGGGYIAARPDCTNCEGDPPYGNGGAFLVQGGWRLSDRLLVGGEIFSTTRTTDQVDLRNTYLLGLAQFRPFGAHGFFVKGGYGVAFVKNRFTVEGVEDTARAWGMGVMYGAGWVFGEGRRVSVAPFGAQYVATVGDVQVTAGTAQNVVINGWFVGAAVMVR